MPLMNRLKNQGLQHRDLVKRMMGLVCFFMSVKMALSVDVRHS